MPQLDFIFGGKAVCAATLSFFCYYFFILLYILPKTALLSYARRQLMIFCFSQISDVGPLFGQPESLPFSIADCASENRFSYATLILFWNRRGGHRVFVQKWLRNFTNLAYDNKQ